MSGHRVVPALAVVMAALLVVIPAEDNAKMVRAFEPVVGYLGGELGVEVEIYTATDYSGIIEAMRSGNVDVAWFGPLSCMLATEVAGAEAIAVQVTEEGEKSTTYHSLMIARADGDIESIEDLRGRSFTFVDPASTSGNLFPRKAFAEAGIDPERDLAETTYAGGHDASALAMASPSRSRRARSPWGRTPAGGEGEDPGGFPGDDAGKRGCRHPRHRGRRRLRRGHGLGLRRDPGLGGHAGPGSRATRQPVGVGRKMVSALVEVRELSKVYPNGTRALGGVSFSVEGRVCGGRRQERGQEVYPLALYQPPGRADLRGGPGVAGCRITGLSGRELRAAHKDLRLIFQQFSLVRCLTALQSVFCGQLSCLRRFSEKDRRIALESLERVG